MSDNERDINTPEWIYGPAGDWSPSALQIEYAQGYGDGFHGSGNEGDEDGNYPLEQFIQDIEDQDDQVLGTLNNAQIEELWLYGIHAEWDVMSAEAFIAWRNEHHRKQAT